MIVEKRCNNRCESIWLVIEFLYRYEVLRYNVNLCYKEIRIIIKLWFIVLRILDYFIID